MLCVFENCDKKVLSRMLCQRHYYFARRKYKNIDKYPLLEVKTPIERFNGMYKVVKSGCWEWRKISVDKKGYGRFVSEVGKFAHRFSYHYHKGKLDPKLTIDHLCRNKRCVNPDHLEQVTQRENVLRGTADAAKNVLKTHCKRGHKLSGKNLFVKKSKNGHRKRYCMECKRLTNRLSYHRLKNKKEAREKTLAQMSREELRLLGLGGE